MNAKLNPPASPPPGSARAKLLELQQKEGRSKNHVLRLIILSAVAIGLVVVLQFLKFDDRGGWAKVPAGLAANFRKGEWTRFGDLLSEDFRCEGAVNCSKAEFFTLAKSYGTAGLALATDSLSSQKLADDKYELRFFVVFSRGDLKLDSTVPLVKTWFVTMTVITEDGKLWQAQRAHVKETLD